MPAARSSSRRCSSSAVHFRTLLTSVFARTSRSCFCHAKVRRRDRQATSWLLFWPPRRPRIPDLEHWRRGRGSRKLPQRWETAAAVAKGMRQPAASVHSAIFTGVGVIAWRDRSLSAGANLLVSRTHRLASAPSTKPSVENGSYEAEVPEERVVLERPRDFTCLVETALSFWGDFGRTCGVMPLSRSNCSNIRSTNSESSPQIFSSTF